MNSGDWQRIQHIRQYCIEIFEYRERFGDSFEAFSEDRAFRNAVSMCILQIGELANGLSKTFQAETKEQIPWQQIRGMRNWIAHAYGEMDEQMIWNTVISDIPMLRDFCNRIQAKEPTQTGPSVCEKLYTPSATHEGPGKRNKCRDDRER